MDLITSSSIKVQTNIDELIVNLKEDIKQKYDVIVTTQTMAESKKLMANINNEKKVFGLKCKSFIEHISAEAIEFKLKKKLADDVFDQAYNTLKAQYDNGMKSHMTDITNILIEYKLSACLERKVNQEVISIKDLILLGSVTPKMLISKGAKEKIDTRISLVENEILKAQIEAEEQIRQTKLIAEKARIEAEEKFKQKEIDMAAKVANDKIEADNAQAKREAEIIKQAEIEKSRAVNDALNAQQSMKEQRIEPTVAKSAPVEIKPVIADDGKRVFTISCDFKVKALKTVSEKKIIDYFLKITKQINLEAKNIRIA